MWSGLFLAPGSVGQWLGTPLFGFIIGVLSLAVGETVGIVPWHNVSGMVPGWSGSGCHSMA